MNIKEHKIGKNNIYVKEVKPDEIFYNHPLILVHGSFGGAFMWKKYIKKLTEAGFHSFVLSLRGHANSGEYDLSQVHMNDYRDDIKEVVDELNLKSPILIGHSMAGLIILMYAAEYDDVSALISMGPSPSKEVQDPIEEEKIKSIPDVYTPVQAGMPKKPEDLKKALPDIPEEMFPKMKKMLGPESGTARRERKRGISIPKEKINSPLLVMGSKMGKSVKFGVSYEEAKNMADYYDADFFTVDVDVTHPGMLMGRHTDKFSEKIVNWLKSLK